MMGLLGTKDDAQALASALYQELSITRGTDTPNLTFSQAQVLYSLLLLCVFICARRSQL